MTDLDENGQPKILELRWKQNEERDVENLLGLAKGLTADGKLVSAEVDYLLEWMQKHPHLGRKWPATVIYARIERMMVDGVIDATERKELFGLLRQMSGPDYPGAIASTELPLATPDVEISHGGFSFCITGVFAYGPRRIVEQEIQTRGGLVHGLVNLSTDFLIVGSVGSRDWKHTSYGNKIETAVRYREKGSRIAIVGEDRWVDALA